MNGEDIPIEQLKSWLQDVKRISHEQRANYHRRQNQLFMTTRSTMYWHIYKQLEPDL